MDQKKEAFWKKLDEIGAADVSANLKTNVYQGQEKPWSLLWLERNSEASKAEQLSLTREAARRAKSANTIATAALAIAIISMIVAIAGVIAPHYWR